MNPFFFIFLFGGLKYFTYLCTIQTKKQINMKKLAIILAVLFASLTYVNGQVILRTADCSNSSGEMKIDYTFSTLNDTYFQITLSEMVSGGLKAKETILEPTSSVNFHTIFIQIVSNKTDLTKEAGKSFTSYVDFLNFMDKNGYDMVDQTKNKYSVDYTFKRK